MSSEERGDRNPEGPLEDNGLGDGDELRVQCSEEELHARTRQRAAGSMNVRKSVRTEHAQVPVSRRREEVDIERVPVGREVPDAALGDEEVVIQVFEEELVVSKRIVLREEIWVRKHVVEEEEVVDVDLRKEEVEIDDQTERGSERGGEQSRESRSE